jgi:hypothetical protein
VKKWPTFKNPELYFAPTVTAAGERTQTYCKSRIFAFWKI